MMVLGLDIKEVSRNFEDFRLENISLQVEKGTIMGVVGANGAGKTTLMRLIMNIYNREHGKILVYDLDNCTDEIKVKNLIGYVADEDYLYFNSTLQKYANSFASIFDEWDWNLFQSLTQKWKLPLDKKFSQFSKGMKTKAMLILALCHKPKLLLMDEPTGGLDPVARIEVLDIVRDFVANGENCVLFSTHITSDLDKIADAVTILIHGKMEESLSVDELADKYLLISAENEKLEECKSRLIGYRKGNVRFEGLILRQDGENMMGFMMQTPNIEQILTYHIWKGEESHD